MIMLNGIPNEQAEFVTQKKINKEAIKMNNKMDQKIKRILECFNKLVMRYKIIKEKGQKH